MPPWLYHRVCQQPQGCGGHLGATEASGLICRRVPASTSCLETERCEGHPRRRLPPGLRCLFDAPPLQAEAATAAPAPLSACQWQWQRPWPRRPPSPCLAAVPRLEPCDPRAHHRESRPPSQQRAAPWFELQCVGPAAAAVQVPGAQHAWRPQLPRPPHGRRRTDPCTGVHRQHLSRCSRRRPRRPLLPGHQRMLSPWLSQRSPWRP